jgi:hypothetical protein
MSPSLFRVLVLVAVGLFTETAIADAAITYSITFVDPGNANSAYYSGITSNLQAAGARWAGYLAGSGNLDVEVEFTTAIARIDGSSFSNGFVHKNGARDVYEQGAAFKLRTGTDPNGSSPDIRVRLNPNYLATELWLDPNPTQRTDPIPANHIDGLSIFTHELAHAFLFAGWMDGTTGALPATYMSTFDEQVQFDGTNFFFIGGNAQAKYGGPVPITYGNPAHLGNLSPRPGADLVHDLMFGPFYSYQERYDLTALDLAIAKDAGVALLPESRLLNIATRMRVQSGENVLIAGFIITGTSSKKVIIRGIGPSLAQFFSGVLANPTLELFQGNTLLASNDDWKENQAEVQATGIPPGNDLESAIVRTLPPGSYSAILRGKDNTSGIAVVEAYDLDQSGNSKLANIATRGFVETGNNVMIAGLITGPAGGATTTVVVRAIGPSLGNFGIAGALQDPTLDLVDANGVVLRSNNDWKDSQQAAIAALNLQPSDDRESTLIHTISPGNYTAVVRGSGNTSGVGLVEIYNVQ